MEESKKIQVIQVKKTGNILVKCKNSFYWVSPKGEVLNTTTKADYKRKLTMVNSNHPDFQWGSITELVVVQGVNRYKKMFTPRAIHKPFEGLHKMLK